MVEREMAEKAFAEADSAALHRLWKQADEDREQNHAAFVAIVEMYAEKKAASPNAEAIAAIERVAKDAVTLAREFVGAMAGKAATKPEPKKGG